MEPTRTIPPDALIAWVVIIAVFASVGLLLLVRLGAAIERGCDGVANLLPIRHHLALRRHVVQGRPQRLVPSLQR
jgi:hypothetical protein